VGESNGVLDQAMRDRLCALAHDVNNALAAIVGHCELILEHAEPGSECNTRLRQVLVIAHAMARRINGHECRMSSAGAQGTLDPDVLLSSIQSCAKPSQSTNPTGSKSAKEG
jgi:signal transduction histidine kinase